MMIDTIQSLTLTFSSLTLQLRVIENVHRFTIRLLQMEKQR